MTTSQNPVQPRQIDGVAAARTLFAGIASAAEEIAGIAYLARGGALLGLRFIPGRKSWVTVPPRQLALDALAFGAHGVVVAHNHPSGDAQPSVEDIAHTRRLARALDAIDVRLFDTLVLAGDATTSFRRLGLL